ncbi:MAG: hypothetical protein U0904_12170 [Candidatus Nanopelagicales bacterium]|nr:hypothetical protein [Candidatus Nanopelagicales bacterium]
MTTVEVDFERRRGKLVRQMPSGDQGAWLRMESLLFEMRRTLGAEHPMTNGTALAFVEVTPGGCWFLPTLEKLRPPSIASATTRCAGNTCRRWQK